MELYEKNGNILYILNTLKKYTDENHILPSTEIQRKIIEDYGVEIDPRTIRRNINLLKYKLDYDISTREENGKGYYITNNPETDFEPGEVRAIIDTFSYANYIVPSIGKNIIKKCKNMQSIYENEKLQNYQIYSNDTKTENMEVIKNIEDISEAIQKGIKIKFDYWKYDISFNKLEKQIVSKPTVSPYALVYNKQEFYLVAIKEGQQDFYYYRLDRIRSLKQTDEKITIKKSSKEIKQFAKSTVEMFGGELVDIKAQCHNYLLDTVVDVFGKDISIIRLNKDYFEINVKANQLGFKFWAMRNIDLVEVIEPVGLRKELIDVIENARKAYRD